MLADRAPPLTMPAKGLSITPISTFRHYFVYEPEASPSCLVEIVATHGPLKLLGVGYRGKEVCVARY